MSEIAMFRQCEHRDSRHPVDLSIRRWSKALKSSSQELPMRKFVFGFSVGVLTFPAAFILLAWLGLFPALANADPPRWEKAFAQMPLNGYVSRHAPHLCNPVPANRREFIGWREDI
jgi:hypothetical protein